MRLAIVGPRDLDLPPSEIARVLREIQAEGAVDLSGVKEIVTGDARGVDYSAYLFAKQVGLPYVRFGAGWGRLKEGAGPERNGRLVNYLERRKDVMLALVDRLDTPGTTSVTNIASDYPVFVMFHKDETWKRYRRKKK